LDAFKKPQIKFIGSRVGTAPAVTGLLNWAASTASVRFRYKG